MTRKRKIVLTIAISFVGIAVTIGVIYVLIGIGFIIPLLENLQADRLITGNTPSVWEASLVFIIVVVYMGILTVGVVFSGLSGWVATHLMDKGKRFSVAEIRELFRIEQT